MIFYSSSINTLDVAINAFFGDSWEAFFVFFDSSSNIGWRLIVVKLGFNKLSQFQIFYYFLSLILGTFTTDIGFMLSFSGIVNPVYFISLPFFSNR